MSLFAVGEEAIIVTNCRCAECVTLDGTDCVVLETDIPVRVQVLVFSVPGIGYRIRNVNGVEEIVMEHNLRKKPKPHEKSSWEAIKEFAGWVPQGLTA